MKYWFTFLAVCALTIAAAQQTERVVIENNSVIYLKGVSNINDFACYLEIGHRTMDVGYTIQNQHVTFENNQLALPVDKFVCDNSRMTRDLKETLKIDQFPLMYLEVLRINNGKTSASEKQVELLITIAGVTKKYCINTTVKASGDNAYHIEMRKAFDMQDFDIVPPTALMGLIKVQEMITIELQLFVDFG